MGLFDWFKTTKVDEVTKNIQEKIEIDYSDFNLVTEYIHSLSGITDLDKRTLTTTRLQQFASTHHIYKTHDFLNEMKNSDEFTQEVINIATVNETYFLREHQELEWLVEYIKNQKRVLQILSMPSSSGEEVYTVLLMLDKAGVDITNITISGFDINSHAIELAKLGVYTEYSLHKLDENIKEKYFSINEDKNYVIDEKLTRQVSFTQNNIFNLVDSFEKYDIILSRNMFIYFDEENKIKALNIIVSLLKNDGIYIKGHADNIYTHEHLENIQYGIYKKNKGI